MADSLFDFLEEPTTPARVSGDTNQIASMDASAAVTADPVREWNEVPQALFLSWSDAMQLAYCRTRDLQSASETDDATEKAWYLTRAELYTV